MCLLRSRSMNTFSAVRSVRSFVRLSYSYVKNQHPRHRRLHALVM